MNKYENIKLENQLCFSFYAISREIIKLYKPILDKFNLTYTQYITMLVIWEEEEINFKRLGEKLHLDSGTLTPVIKKLEAMELVTKYRTKEDDRVVVVKLTEKGKTLKDDIIGVPNEISCKIDIEKNQYLELKESLKAILEKLS